MEMPSQVTEKKSVLEEIAELQQKAKLCLEALQLLDDKDAALERAKREVIEARKACEVMRKDYSDANCALYEKNKSLVEDSIYKDIGQMVFARENSIRDLLCKEW